MLKSLTLFLSFFIWFNCNSQEIIGKWQFQNISSIENSESLKKIGSDDLFYILEDGTFNYNIESSSLIAMGDWSFENNTLKLVYELPIDTIRYYQTSLKESSLTLTENQINYTFKKESFINNNSKKNILSDILRGILGVATLIFICFLFSRNRRNINWNVVWKGLLVQLIFAVCILKVPFVQNGFEWLSSIFVTILGFTREGSLFLFGGLIENTESFGYIFAFQVLPTIIFFSAITSVLFYYGILQKVVLFFARIMRRLFHLSGAESLATVGNIFLGQTESPLLVKPYIKNMTLSELFCLMSGGMATIAGGVLAAYIGFLGGNDPVTQLFFAKHLLAASVMSAPAAIVASKIIYPETQKISSEIKISNQDLGSNVLEALSIGTTQGLKLAVNVGAMLLVFIAFIAMINYFLGNVIGQFLGINSWVVDISKGQYQLFSLEFILGYTLAPLTWLMGVCKEDIVLVGQLLGEKIVLNEFVAYISLGELKNGAQFFENKSVIIATYILCGFANFASIGIQIAGIGTLAPERTKDLSKLGMLSLVSGTMACLFTAVIVGMII
ncbi:MAG: nucleoside transporter C-terminal domain-containing protein [Flavobacteriales bacterium]|jgi:CNT family concentrative nucleoside transporter|tara:strand:+ start:19356 stop:21026 length:1671 start_codon:yes stop_codon:yes gene_type:complete